MHPKTALNFLSVGLAASAALSIQATESQCRAIVANSAATQKTLAHLAPAVRESTELSNAAASLRTDLDAYAANFSCSTAITSKLDDLENLAKASSLLVAAPRAIRSELIARTDHQGQVTEQVMSLELRGDFNAFQTFINHVEAQGNSYRLRAMHVTRLPQSSGEIVAVLTIGIFLRDRAL